MNFELNILGCGSAKPTRRHQPSSQILNVRGKYFMIDCGEGAQTQMQMMGLSMANIGHIFISHNHGDHVFGLPGLIGTMDLLGRTAELHIHGPQQVGELISFLLQTYYADIQYRVLFHPIDPTIHTLIYEDRSITVHSIPLQHRVPSVGFLFRGKPLLPHVRREMISYAYCSDTVYLPQLKDILHGVTLLYHEATYLHERALRAEQTRHSTAIQAAMQARDAEVGQLCIGHFSATVKDESLLLQEAQNIFPNTVLAREGLVISI